MKRNGFAPLVIILVIAILGMAGYVAFKSNAFLISQSPSPSAQVSKDTTTYSGNGFSFAYPKDLYPLASQVGGYTLVEFYVDKEHATQTTECQKLNSNKVPAEPCGVGALVYEVKIYLNPSQENIDLINNARSSTKEPDLTDSSGRKWIIVRAMPTTGGYTPTTSRNAMITDNGKTHIISIGAYDGFTDRINLDFIKTTLSTFKFIQ